MVTLSESWLELSLASSQPSRFHYAWLRDNCACPECKHPDTKERTLITAEIPDDIQAVSAAVEGDKLVVNWNDRAH
ncbi:MAG: gamma-butyrobetaine hydroxylase-like domain-containing protein, partial [Pseudomonadota bacterium]